MRAEYLRFAASGFFALMALVLFCRDWIIPDLASRLQGDRLTFGGWFALILSGWNAARGYQILAERRARSCSVSLTYHPHPDRDREPFVPNPELDFFKPADEPSPPPAPSTNGDGKTEMTR